jgi:PBP1b-binding outer membrane lipoprotein LpoB
VIVERNLTKEDNMKKINALLVLLALILASCSGNSSNPASSEITNKVPIAFYKSEVEKIKADGLFKGERVIASPQSSAVTTADGTKMINMWDLIWNHMLVIV